MMAVLSSADFASATFDLLTGSGGDAAKRVHQSVHIGRWAAGWFGSVILSAF